MGPTQWGERTTLVNTVWTQRCIHVPARTGLALSVVNTWGKLALESNATCVGINNNNDDSIRSYKAFCNYNSRVVNKFYSDNTCTSEKQTEVVYAAAPNNDNCVCPGGPPYLHLAMPPAQTLAIRTTTPIIGTELTT